MQQKYFWPKLIGAAVLLHVALILLSIIEVVIYSYLIAPGKDEAFYSAHATVSGPWISAIFGSLFMFLLVRRYLKRFPTRQLAYTIALPAIYQGIDLLILLAAGYQFQDYVGTFVLAMIPKAGGVTLAYFIYRNKTAE